MTKNPTGPQGTAESQGAAPPQSAARLPITRALISVYDKTGLAELAAGLRAAGVRIVSTGQSARAIADAGVEVSTVEELTGFGECLDGRVKTLHPAVHAGLLADRTNPAHVQALDEMGIAGFDLVVCNLYPFAETVRSGADQPSIIEKIDIGGPSMVRAAAKNHASVAVVVDPARYQELLAAVREGGFTVDQRRRLAADAFAHTAGYDTAVATWCANELSPDESGWPAFAGLALERADVLRYGENPHQQAALYVAHDASPGLAQSVLLHGKPMSYNNYVDADAAIRAAYDFADPAVAVIKHSNPCGLATVDQDADIALAHRRANDCDPVSAFGGVVAANRPVSAAMADQLADTFTEVIVAPGFEPQAYTDLTRKKNVRLLELPAGYRRDPRELRQVSGGMLVQAGDRLDAPGDDPAGWNLAAGEPVDEDTLADLLFAWRAVRAVRSNAILLATDRATVGVGMGQVNRVDAARLAVQRAGADRARGSVAASDAFFPFPDGLRVLTDAGVRAVVQPGGSMRDDEVVMAAHDAGISLYLTGTRHFAH